MSDQASATATGPSVQPAVLSYSDFRIRPHNCFACGQLNEIGLHLQLNLEPGLCWTELEMPRQFEGWEGLIHGGILCTILDEVMAWSLVSEDNWGVTAKMSVNFRKPVVVGQHIRAEGRDAASTPHRPASSTPTRASSWPRRRLHTWPPTRLASANSRSATA